MNLVADESVDRQIVDHLRHDGHDVLSIAEIEPTISDNTVFDKANSASAVLITSDKDFGEIVFKEKRLISDGVILLRLAGLTPDKKAEAVSESIREYADSFSKHFCVISPGRVRISSKV